MKIVSVVLAAFLLAACGNSGSVYILDNDIVVHSIEMRMPTSTVPLGVVTQRGKVVGVVGGTARPIIDIPLSILGAGSTVGGAAILGGAIKGGLKSIESLTPTE